MPNPISKSEIASYHAHVYFDTNDAVQMERARCLHTWISERFLVQIGRLGTRPGGPHPLPMFEVAFGTVIFAELVPWLMMNHQGLSVLIHPNTDNMRDDHLVNPLWLGPALTLLGFGMPTSLREQGSQQPPIVVNTSIVT
jgi:DOPA 4,5-dioxygenase